MLPRLFQLEALAVGALNHSGVALVRAHLDGVQAAELVVLAVVGAVVNGTPDALVGRAGAAAVGTVLGHGQVLLREDFPALRRGPLSQCEAAPQRNPHSFDERQIRALPAPS